MKKLSRKYNTLYSIPDLSSSFPIADNSPDLISLVDINNKLVYVNRAFLKVLGRNKSDLIGRDIQDILNFEKVTGRGQGIRIDQKVYRFRDRKGMWIWVENTVFPLQWEKMNYICTVSHNVSDRVRYEDEVRKSNQKSQFLLKHAPSMIYEIDFRVPKFVSVNDAMCKSLGYSRRKLLSMNPYDLLDEKGQKLLKRRAESFLAGKQIPNVVEYKAIKRNGDSLDCQLYMTFTYESNAPVGAIVVAHDITERNRVEQILRDSEEQFKAITETAPVSIGIVGFPKGDFLYVNTSYEKSFGYAKGELIGKSAPDVYWNLMDRERMLAMLRKKGNVNEYEVKVKRKDGSVFWAMSSARPITYMGQSALLGAFVDISQRKRLEIILQKKSDELQRILDSVPAMVFIKDRQNRFIWTNRIFERAMGMSKKMLSGKSLYGIYSKKQAQAYWKDDVEVMQSGKAKRGIIEPLETPYGVRIIETDKIPYLDDDGKVIGIIGFAIDITERKKTEEMLKDLDKKKDEFISIASHELKTPLTSIKAFVQILERRFRENKEDNTVRILGKVNEQINKLTNLVSTLLDVTKIQSGKLVYNDDYFIIDDLIKEVIDDIQLTMSTTSHKNNFIFAGKTSIKIHADRYRIGQVLSNLLINAIKYSTDHDKIVITINQQKSFIIVSVKDFGIGIPTESMGKVFDRFYQINPQNNQKGLTSLGMGLYISAKIIKRHGGKIWVDSILGKGSTFYFSLPIH